MSRGKLGLCCLVLLVLLPIVALGQQAPAFEAPEGYAPCASNADWTLYLREENLGLIMLNNVTGQALYSCVPAPDEYPGNEQWKALYTSGIVMDYLSGTVIEPLRADFTYMKNEKSFTYTDNGFTCEAYFPDVELGFTVTVELRGNDLTIDIPLESLRQDNEEAFAISAFYVYPFMGYSYMGENGGYIFIPDGQGAIINLEDNENRYSSPFTQTVYGPNIGLIPSTESSVYNGASTNNPAERIMMPVFGMTHADQQLGYVSVIEKGDENALIEANFNGVSNLPFDWVFAKYTYRVVYSQQTGPSSGTVNRRLPHINRFDIRQHFYFLSGDNANYCGMARQYGDYLQSIGTFEGADDPKDFAVQLDFVGTENENGMLATQPVTMTSAEQMTQILDDLRSRGVDSVLSVVQGWQHNGLSGGLPLTGYNVSGAIGGKDALEAMLKSAKDAGVKVYLDTDPFTMTQDTAGMLRYSALKKVDSSTYTRPLYSWVYNTRGYLTPSKLLENALSLAGSYQQEGVAGASISGFPAILTAYYYDDQYHDKSDCRDFFEQAAKGMGEKVDTVLSDSNAYLWRYAKALVDMPVAGSDYTYTDAEVPFMAIALSGRIPLYTEYTNFQANTQRFFLQLVEQGTRPSFLITWEDPIELSETNANWIYSSKYSLYADMITDWYARLKELSASIDGSAITSHERKGDLVTVGYENGLKIYINYGDKPVRVNRVTLDALSYKVVSTLGR